MLTISDEYTTTLMKLGLNSAQARTYLALLKKGMASTGEVAKISGVARPDTYRTIAELHELGLVEKLLTAPIKFRPLPVEDAVGILMLRRTHETIELNERTNRLVKNFEERNNHTSSVEESQFVLVSKGDTLILKAQKMMENAQETISLIVPQRRLRPFIANNFDIIKNALERKVAMRTITEGHIKNRSIEFLELEKFGLFEIGYVMREPCVFYVLIDSKEILLITSAKTEYSESPAVWSNNLGLIELAQGYFELTWNALSAAKITTVG